MTGPQRAKCAADRRWCRFWSIYAVVTFTTGVVADTIAYVRCGQPATLSAHIERWFGMHPRTRYARAGQVAVGGFLAWAAIHLTTGTLGPSRGRQP